jgi:type I restriction enzyme M protein
MPTRSPVNRWSRPADRDGVGAAPLADLYLVAKEDPSKPVGARTWTNTLWIYDLRTNQHFTLKTNLLKRSDLDEFVACYCAANRHKREATWSDTNPQGRWRSFTYDELLQRDKVSLDIFWLKDDSLEDSAGLDDPDVIAAEIVEDLHAALAEFELIQEDLTGK